MTELLFVVEMGTSLNGVGIGLEPVLTLAVHDTPRWLCEVAAWILSYDLPAQTNSAGVITGEVISSCVEGS